MAAAARQHVTTRIVVLGGGVGGLAAARHLDRLVGRRPETEVVLISRDNFLLLTPLLFEACSGVLEFRHCAQPIRPCLRHARFIEATVQGVDPGRRCVTAAVPDGPVHELTYDHLVVALGAATNMDLIPGSQHARTFKTVADGLLLRTHMIERFERAEYEPDPERRRRQLTVVIIGGGLVGVELTGELTAFTADILRYYPRISRQDVSFHLFEAGLRLLPESTARLARYATRILERRRVAVHLRTLVRAIEPRVVRTDEAVIAADTIVLAAGIVPSPVAAAIPVARDDRGRIMTEATLRSTSHPEIWAIGDCARVPSPDGTAYPPLAQHATREGRAVARNIHAVLERRAPKPFRFEALGSMAAFGHTRAAADVRGIPLSGFIAWWVRRTYYLLQIPRWDTRLRIALDWTVALFFRPDTSKVDLAAEPELERRGCAAGAEAAVTSRSS
jgi:NADH dehydrogenase